MQDATVSEPGTNKTDIVFNCNTCPYKSRSRGNLYRHKKAVHKKAKIQFDSCAKEFSQKYDLDLHKKTVHQNMKLLFYDIF